MLVEWGISLGNAEYSSILAHGGELAGLACCNFLNLISKVSEITINDWLPAEQVADPVTTR